MVLLEENVLMVLVVPVEGDRRSSEGRVGLGIIQRSD